MKRIFILVFLGALLLHGTMAKAFELEIIGGLSNLLFDPEAKEPLGGDIEDFPGVDFIYGMINIKDQLGDKYSYNLHAERDPVMQNTLTGSISLDLDYLNFEFGPFIGLFNTEEQIIKPGVMTGLKVQYPGIVFLSMKAASTFGFNGSFNGDYSLDTGEISLGFWLPFVIPSASVIYKNFIRQDKNDSPLLLSDEFIRYQAGAEIFAKNFPLIIRLDFGYENLTRRYTNDSNKEDIDELMVMFAGIGVKWQFLKKLQIIAGYEMPIYTWTEKPSRKMISENTFLYQLRAGIMLTF